MKKPSKCLIFAIITVAAICFCSCARQAAKQADETTSSSSAESTSAAEAKTDTTAYSQTSGSGRIYYDRYGNEYDSYQTLPIYDSEGKSYTFVSGSSPYYLAQDGTKYPSHSCYVDIKSNFIYDKEDEFSLSDDSMSATDKNGNTYYPAETVLWDEDGNLVTAFGFGETIKQ